MKHKNTRCLFLKEAKNNLTQEKNDVNKTQRFFFLLHSCVNLNLEFKTEFVKWNTEQLAFYVQCLKTKERNTRCLLVFESFFWLMLIYKAQQMKQTRDMTKHCEEIPRAFTSHNSFKFRIFKLKFSQRVKFFNVFLCFEIHRLSKLIIFFSMVCIEIQIGFESGRSKSIFFPIKTFF